MSAISVIIPALNEAELIGYTIKEIKNDLKEMNIPFEIIVIDGGSIDNTPLVANESGADSVCLFAGKGKGMAIRSVFDKTINDIIVSIDADGSYNPKSIPSLIEPIMKGKADLVIGTRYTYKFIPITRKISMKIFVLLLSLLLGIRITDPFSGFIAFRKEILTKIKLDSTLGTEMDFIIQSTKVARIQEVPIKLRNRLSFGYSISKLNPTPSLLLNLKILKSIISERMVVQR